MATDTVKTTAITNLDATPVVRANSWVHGGNAKHFVGTVEATAGAAPTSTYRFYRIGSWMRPSSLRVAMDAISAGAFDLGLYRTAADGGAVVDSSILASTVSAGTATLATEVLYKGKDIANAEKRVWELLGLTVDPNLEYDVTATVITAQSLANAGTIDLFGTMSW